MIGKILKIITIFYLLFLNHYRLTHISIFLIIHWKKPRIENDMVSGTADALIHAHRLKWNRNCLITLQLRDTIGAVAERPIAELRAAGSALHVAGSIPARKYLKRCTGSGCLCIFYVCKRTQDTGIIHSVGQRFYFYFQINTLTKINFRIQAI